MENKEISKKRKIENDIGIKCPKCNKDCELRWQIFSTGLHHIKQSCPEHGHIRFAPQFEEYAKIADQSKQYKKEVLKMKSLLDY